MTTTPDRPTTGDCGCGEFRSSRRSLIKAMAATAGGTIVTGLVGDVFTQASFAATTGGNTLVVLSLRGGCDGLSLVVPHGDLGYAGLRPGIAVPTSQLLVKDAVFGLHPSFAALEPMWRAGTFGAVQAVGLPQPNRSHFAAMEAVEDADPGSSARVGWINRMIGMTGSGIPHGAMQLGSSLTPTSLVGPAPALAVHGLSRIAMPGGNDAALKAAFRSSLQSMWGGNNSPMGRGVALTLETTDRLSGLAQSADTPQNGAAYPSGGLGAALRQTARLIRADVGTQVVTLDHGSWDMHADLGTTEWGEMTSMVGEMAKSLAAFFTDLGALGDKVTVVTISEFGRTARENGNYGTDHGYGNAMLLLGGGVHGGTVHGRWPGLSAGAMVDGDLAVTSDYRSVLAEVLASRFPAASIPQVFPGLARETLGVMR